MKDNTCKGASKMGRRDRESVCVYLARGTNRRTEMRDQLGHVPLCLAAEGLAGGLCAVVWIRGGCSKGGR